jgi:hypothetical protein
MMFLELRWGSIAGVNYRVFGARIEELDHAREEEGRR